MELEKSHVFRAYQDSFQDIDDRLSMLLEDLEPEKKSLWEDCLDKLEAYFRDNLLYLRDNDE